MPLTEYTRKYFLNSVCRGGTGDDRYLALSSTMPNPDGTNVTEPVGNGYARGQIDNAFDNTISYDSINDIYSKSNVNEIKMPEATGSWGTLGYFAIYTNISTGTMVAYGSLQSPISPIADTVPIIRVGQCVVSEQ